MVNVREFRPYIPHEVKQQRVALDAQEPIDLEIGCGVGLHPIQYAQNHPERQLIAIEHTAAKFAKFQRRLAHHPPLPRLFAIHANALSWCAYHISPAQLSRVMILYPNPYPKAKHANQRWHHMAFMGFLKSRLQSQGTVELSTNLDWYADEACAVMQSLWGFKLLERQCIIQGDKVGRTHFERKYLAAGQSCYRLVFGI